MPKVSLHDMSGKAVGDLELKPEIFEAAPNIPLMHQVVMAEEANARQGTAATKTRGDVSGGGAKPFRQKGTGRARQGSSRSPLQYHGGVVFGPHPRSYKTTPPRKMRRGALKSALSARVADGAVIVVDEIKMDAISTKAMAAFLSSFEAVGKTLVVLEGISNEVRMSSRNIPGLALRISPAVSVREVLNADKIVMTRAAVQKLEEVFGS
jgi:large subunit ribosomal protein L4